MGTLFVEAVDASDGGRLVVAPQNGELVGVLYFEGKEEADGLDALPAPINIVPQEQVVGLGREAPVLEEPQHVVVLPVHIPAYFDGGAHLNQHGLLQKDRLHGADKSEDILLLEFDHLAGLCRPHLQEGFDDLIDLQLVLLDHTINNLNIFTFIPTHICPSNMHFIRSSAALLLPLQPHLRHLAKPGLPKLLPQVFCTRSVLGPFQKVAKLLGTVFELCLLVA